MLSFLPLAVAAASVAADADAMGRTPAGVVRAYYRALAARDYSAAYALWGDDGRRSGHSAAAFARGFAGTRSTRVTVAAAVDVEGGAGSLYATVPVAVDAVLADGRRQHFAGHYVVRRVNGVDGAAASRLRWHLESASLRPTR